MTASGICPAAATGADHFTNVAYLSIFDDPTKVRFFVNSYLVAGVVTIRDGADLHSDSLRV
jgi:hypothetical protein